MGADIDGLLRKTKEEEEEGGERGWVLEKKGGWERKRESGETRKNRRVD